MTDPIQHLREVVHISKTGTVTIEPDATIEDLRKVVMSMNRLPALLAVAEAAAKMRIARDVLCFASEEDVRDASDAYEKSEEWLYYTLAKLREIKP